MKKSKMKITKNLYIDDIQSSLTITGNNKLKELLETVLPADFIVTCSVTVGDCLYYHKKYKDLCSESYILDKIQNIYDTEGNGSLPQNLTGYITRGMVITTLMHFLDVPTQMRFIKLLNTRTYRPLYKELTSLYKGTIRDYLSACVPGGDISEQQGELGNIRRMCASHLSNDIATVEEGVVLFGDVGVVEEDVNLSSPEFITAMQSVSDCSADQDKPIIGVEVDDAFDHAVGAVGSVIDSDVDHAVEKKRGQYDEKLKATQTQIKKVANQLTKLTAQKEKLETKRDLLDVLGTNSGKRLLEWSISKNRLSVELNETSCVEKRNFKKGQSIYMAIDNNGDIETNIHQNHCIRYWETPEYGYDKIIVKFQCIITDAKFDEFLSMIQKNVLHITWDMVKAIYDVLFDDKNFVRLVYQQSSKQILSIRSHPIMKTWNEFFRDKDIKTKDKKED